MPKSEARALGIPPSLVLQMLVPVISLAFLIVIASTIIYTPLLLYLFDLRKVGWLWEHGALFSAMISSTDAVAVSAILKKGDPRWHFCVMSC